MAKSKRSKRSRKSSLDSSSSSSSDSDSSSSSSTSSSSSSDFLDTKPKKFVFKKRISGRLAKWVVKGIPEKQVKAAREAFKPSVEKLDKRYDASNVFTNPRLDETLYAALKSVKNSSAAIANIDPQEKVYRRQTDLILDMAKPLLFLVNKNKFKKKSSDALALKSLTMLWCHLFKDISTTRRLTILSPFSAALVNISVAPSATSTPVKPRPQPPAGPSNPNFSQRYHDSNRATNFVDGWTQLSLDPWVLSTISSGFKLDFFGNPLFNASRHRTQRWTRFNPLSVMRKLTL
ncbi:hypothetical protein OUZ56_011442 [Daphnia magna]|uniref:Uncharacterized protein n=1 Tax=Daphnia magna TaxID=35525 RepID=A0ABQ9Z0I8_9CRUS|nr:hypothetical protein OUZ56_011442 [Daphnia magna]